MFSEVKTRYGLSAAVRPNWSNPVVESYSYKTSMFTSRYGVEQRQALRQTPRMNLRFQADHAMEASQRFATDLLRWPEDGRFMMPMTHRYVELTSDHAAGLIVLSVSDVDLWWIQEGSSLIIESATAVEVVTIESVGSTTITLTEELQTDYSEGDRVYYAVLGRFDQKKVLRSPISLMRSGSINFEVDPGIIAEFPRTFTGPIHEGHPVFYLKPNWRESVENDYDDMRETVDFGYGVVDVGRYYGETVATFSHAFTVKTIEEYDYVRNFFCAMKGKRGTFWMPTYMEDFEVVGSVLEDATGFTVKGSEFQFYQDSDHYNTIMVRWADGAVQLNRISSITADGANTAVAFEDAWERDFSNDEVICFAVFARFETDTLEITWETDLVGEFRLPVKTLENDFLTAGDGSGGEVTPPYNDGETNTSFDDPTDYAELDFASHAVPIHAVMRSKGVVTATYDGECRTRGPFIDPLGPYEPCAVGIAIRFYDDDGNMVPGLAGQPNSQYGNYEQWSLSVTAAVPPKATAVRAVATCVRWSPSFSDIFNFSTSLRAGVSTPGWGFYIQEDNLYVP